MLEADCISHFVSVLQCTRCDNANCAKLLRDNSENLPQPGYVGANYSAKRILLVGQNPGVSTTALSQQDRHYTSALSALRDHPSAESWSQLQLAMMKFVPQWPVSGKHFPLHESGLTLKDIAYCNLVRCRTINNAAPSSKMISNCASHHFQRTLEILKPAAIVFIGKWAMTNGKIFAQARNIPFDYVNRNRSMTSAIRKTNHERVALFLRGVLFSAAPTLP